MKYLQMKLNKNMNNKKKEDSVRVVGVWGDTDGGCGKRKGNISLLWCGDH